MVYCHTDLDRIRPNFVVKEPQVKRRLLGGLIAMAEKTYFHGLVLRETIELAENRDSSLPS